jgi:hypothetical protein
VKNGLITDVTRASLQTGAASPRARDAKPAPARCRPTCGKTRLRLSPRKELAPPAPKSRAAPARSRPSAVTADRLTPGEGRSRSPTPRANTAIERVGAGAGGRAPGADRHPGLRIAEVAGRSPRASRSTWLWVSQPARRAPTGRTRPLAVARFETGDGRCPRTRGGSPASGRTAYVELREEDQDRDGQAPSLTNSSTPPPVLGASEVTVS